MEPGRRSPDGPAERSIDQMTPEATAQLAKSLARAVGFDQVGIAPAAPLDAVRYYTDWLKRGYAGEMGYLRRNVDLRGDPRGLLPGARSVVCVALNYHRGAEPERPAGATGRVARYARGRDYHTVVRGMLEELAERLRGAISAPFDVRPCVDTAPVLERELARQAGIGWVGKNTMILHHELGSYLYLGELLTTLEMVPDTPLPDRCGTCTRCLEACPAEAFPEAHVLDGGRCISALTIEQRGEIEPELQAVMGDWVFGCDVCQEVCPHNRRAPEAEHPDVRRDTTPAHLDLPSVAELAAGDYRRLTRDSAARRARRNMWRRNAIIALGNRAQLSAAERSVLERARDDADAAVAHAAREALRRHGA